MSFLQWADSIDKQLFTFIHHALGNRFLDPFMLFLRNPPVWAPLYIFVIYWVIRYHKTYAFKFITLSIVTVAFTDFISAKLIKPFAGRLRPCHTAELQPVLRHILDCGGMYSFPSSHASNHFGLAAFWFGAVFFLTGKKWHWLWVWAGLICFAQVYVGVHYPFDVTCGALFGWATGTTTAIIFKRWATPKIPTGNRHEQVITTNA